VADDVAGIVCQALPQQRLLRLEAMNIIPCCTSAAALEVVIRVNGRLHRTPASSPSARNSGATSPGATSFISSCPDTAGSRTRSVVTPSPPGAARYPAAEAVHVHAVTQMGQQHRSDQAGGRDVEPHVRPDASAAGPGAILAQHASD
jgi:hypothetical protein